MILGKKRKWVTSANNALRDFNVAIMKKVLMQKERFNNTGLGDYSRDTIKIISDFEKWSIFIIYNKISSQWKT